MADGLMVIGTFSRASQPSVKALRASHEAAILVPARVDPDTGYRSYHSTQLTDAAVILLLRALGLPLPPAPEVVHARDPGDRPGHLETTVSATDRVGWTPAGGEAEGCAAGRGPDRSALPAA